MLFHLIKSFLISRFIRIKPLSMVYNLSMVMKPTPMLNTLSQWLYSTNLIMKIIIHPKIVFTLNLNAQQHHAQLCNSYIFSYQFI